MLKEQLRVVYGLEDSIPKDKNGIPTDNKSEVEMVVSDAIQNRRVDFNLGGLAGHEAGIEQLPDGTTYMIERSGRWVEPVKGDWSPIERLINGLFRDGQAEYVLGNLCIWVRDYYAHDYAPRPTMVFAGPKKCGKNLFQEVVVTGILGGTSVDPTQYMTSVTPFNSDLFAAPHQLIADSLHSNDQKFSSSRSGCSRYRSSTRHGSSRSDCKRCQSQKIERQNKRKQNEYLICTSFGKSCCICSI